MPKKQAIIFTDEWVKSISFPIKGRGYYSDALEKGFGLYTTPNGVRTFYLRKRIKGRDERIIIGSAELLSVEKARLKAKLIKEQISEGLDPAAERKRAIFKELTLGVHCKEYIEIYSKHHKKTWKHDQRDIDRFFSPWFHRRMGDITRFEVQKLYQMICKEHGIFQANRTLERLNGIYNKAIEWGWEGQNPAKKIKRHRETQRERFIQPEEMPFLIQSLNNEPSVTARDYFWMLLFTGARKTNMLMMRWEEINWKRETWRIPDTKNGESILLPLLDRAINLLKERLEFSQSEWVFPSKRNPGQHFVNAKRAWRRIITRATIYQWYEEDQLKVIIDECQSLLPKDNYNNQWMRTIRERAKQEGIELPIGLMDTRLHDIRRTFGSYQAINGTNLLVIGRSLGHKCQKSTLVYARLSLDPVRSSIKNATDVMLGTATLNKN
jgi:integrase